jgi:hypothetical protein
MSTHAHLCQPMSTHDKLSLTTHVQICQPMSTHVNSCPPAPNSINHHGTWYCCPQQAVEQGCPSSNYLPANNHPSRRTRAPNHNQKHRNLHDVNEYICWAGGWGRGGGCNGILCQIMLDPAQSSTAQSRAWQKVLKVHLLPTRTQYDIVPPISRLEIDRSQWSHHHMTDVNDDENEFIWLFVLYSAPFIFLLDVVQIVYHCMSVDCQHYFQWLPASKTWNNIFTPDFVPDIRSLCTIPQVQWYWGH